MTRSQGQYSLSPTRFGNCRELRLNPQPRAVPNKAWPQSIFTFSVAEDSLEKPAGQPADGRRVDDEEEREKAADGHGGSGSVAER